MSFDCLYVHRSILLAFFGEFEENETLHVMMNHDIAEFAFRLMYGGAELVHTSAYTWMRNYFKEKKTGPKELLAIVDEVENWLGAGPKGANALVLSDVESIEYI